MMHQSIWSTILQHLHAFTGVAQLKQAVPFFGCVRPCDLHAFTGVAQLKRCEVVQIARSDVISTPSPAWPN